MEKAYDIKDLGARLKDSGLDLAEDAAVIVIEKMFEWIEESAKMSASPYDDMALLIMPQLKDLAMKQADKIDGKQG